MVLLFGCLGLASPLLGPLFLWWGSGLTAFSWRHSTSALVGIYASRCGWKLAIGWAYICIFGGLFRTIYKWICFGPLRHIFSVILWSSLVIAFFVHLIQGQGLLCFL